MKARPAIALAAGFSALGALLGTAATLALRNDPVVVPRVDLSSVRVAGDANSGSTTTLAPVADGAAPTATPWELATIPAASPAVTLPDPTTSPGVTSERESSPDMRRRDPGLEDRASVDGLPEIATVPAAAPAVTLPDPTTTPAVVPGLEQRRGIVQYRGDEFRLEGRELDVGPEWWLTTTNAPDDVDGDGRVGTWWQEISGLLGREVTVLGEVDDDDIDVFEIDGVSLRPLYSEIAPWSDGWTASRLSDELTRVMATGLTADEAVRIALEAIPGIAIDVQIDIDGGRPYWEVDIRSTDGARYDVEVDAATGTIIDIDRS